MENNTTLIACGIFKNELDSVLGVDNCVDIHWLDAALHADGERMKTMLESTIMDHKTNPNNRIHLLFGNGCHPDICRIAENCGSQIPPVKNCIQAIIGPEKTTRLETDRTMVVTPGWITAWPDIMKGLGWDEIDVRINIGRYNRILLIDTGVAAVADEEILSFYDLVQVPIEIEPVNLEYFKNLINQILDQPE